MKYRTIFACLVLLAMSLNHAKSDDEATITGEIYVPNDSQVKVDPKTLAISIEEQVEYDNPPLPENFEQMTLDERRAWFEKFEQSEEGKAYEQAQRKKFDERRKYKVELDDDGKFKVEDVLPGKYMINGYTESTIEGKTYQFVVQGELEVTTAKNVNLEPFPVDIVRVLNNGEQAPQIKIPGLSEGNIDLAEHNGKYVFINFWLSGSDPCKETLPKVKELFDAHSDGQDLVILGICVDSSEQKAAAKQFVNDNGYSWKQGFTGGFDHQVVNDYGISGIPSFWLVSPDGKIVKTDRDFFRSFEETVDIKMAVEEAVKAHKAVNN